MNPELKRVAGRQGGVFSRRQARDAGYTPAEMRERLAQGRWERLRYGQYAERTDGSGLARWDRPAYRHRLLTHAAMNSMKSGSAVVSHHSALILHGIPVWQADLTEVQLTRANARAGVTAGVRHHQARLPPEDVTTVDDLPATSVARALVEIASTATFAAAVISADAALRHPEMSTADLWRLAEATEHWPGSPMIRRTLAFADRLAESAGESRLRVVMRNEDLPPPQLQVEFTDAEGFIGRVDFFFPEFNTIVEFDGLMKYGDGSREALIREKLREDRLRALGLEVVRIIWSDLDDPAQVAASIRRAFARARRTSA
ncbi:type IV toxin-antitoxin system AbiEi family antitoxin domain-containing protein [Kribbella sp. NPDC058245]|uniref:type IV toxin-antitoxin system AbiEi family antitoxin domain-containing protein n=1 Tax=Kribbella sp. NPDC058245 TaxID=3346399 RepID=UPI0036EDCA97